LFCLDGFGVGLIFLSDLDLRFLPLCFVFWCVFVLFGWALVLVDLLWMYWRCLFFLDGLVCLFAFGYFLSLFFDLLFDGAVLYFNLFFFVFLERFFACHFCCQCFMCVFVFRAGAFSCELLIVCF